MTTSAKFQLSTAADKDLFEIYTYTFQTWGEAQAVKYVGLLKEGMKAIAAAPERLGSADRSYIAAGYRSIRIKHHVVFYRRYEEGILIVRILHERMDVSKQFQAKKELESENDKLK